MAEEINNRRAQQFSKFALQKVKKFYNAVVLLIGPICDMRVRCHRLLVFSAWSALILFKWREMPLSFGDEEDRDYWYRFLKQER